MCLFSLAIAFAVFICAPTFAVESKKETETSSAIGKDVIKKANTAIFEVVVPKEKNDAIVYEKPLPLDKLSYRERTDKYFSIGTAFAIAPNRFISAAHVFHMSGQRVHKEYFLRDMDGNIYSITSILKYSNYRDLIEFEIKSPPKNLVPLKIKREVSVGDNVVTAGNALGNGIAYRGGQVSSFSPEPVNGVWKDIRISAPTSPGNSGGPLLNNSGEVVGVVVRATEQQNLNVAIPIGELENVSDKTAEFVARKQTFKADGYTVTDDWNFEYPLPATYNNLAEAAQNSLHNFVVKLDQKLSKDGAEEVFPTSPAFRVYLHDQTYPNNFMAGLFIKDHTKTWLTSFPKVTPTKISGDQKMYWTKSGKTLFAEIDRAKGVSLKTWNQSPKLIMDSIIMGLGETRNIGGEQIRILSYGPPASFETFEDKMGRYWRSATWFRPEVNSVEVLTCTPTPRGSFCLAQLDSYGTEFKMTAEKLIDRMQLSYRGPLDGWKDFMELESKTLPKILRGGSLKIDKTHFAAKFAGESMNVDVADLDDDWFFTAFIGRSVTHENGPELMGLTLSTSTPYSRAYSLWEIYSKTGDDDKERKKVWKQVVEKTGNYDGKPYVHANKNGVRLVLNKTSVTPYGTGSSENIERQWILGCTVDINDHKNKVEEICASAKVQAE